MKHTRYWYDTEFLDNGRTIDLISIGIVADDGREYYAVNADATRRPLTRRIRRHPWLMANVVPHLPKAHGDRRLSMPRRWLFDYASPHVQSRQNIANQVRQFLLASYELAGGEPELWAWYGAYDHVALAQLWGPMCDMPTGLPQHTNDLKQLHHQLGSPELPPHGGDVHNALADARWNRQIHEVMDLAPR